MIKSNKKAIAEKKTIIQTPLYKFTVLNWKYKLVIVEVKNF